MCDLLIINTERGVMINDGKSKFSINGKPIYHLVHRLSMNPLFCMLNVWQKINPEAPLDKVCILSCCVSTGIGATLNAGKPKKGSTVAVFGLGGVGLAVSTNNKCSLYVPVYAY